MAKPTGITFVCNECHRERAVARLSQYSLDEADTRSKSAALLALPEEDIICEDCDDAHNSLAEDLAEERLGRSEAERFIFSGLDAIDPAMLQAYRLNY